MKLLIFSPSLSLGGAERVAVAMVNWWAVKGYEVTLALMGSDTAYQHYVVHPDVKIRYLDIYRPSSGLFERCRAVVKRHWHIRSLVQTVRPDVVISHIDSINTRVLLSCLGLSVPVIVAEHTDPLHYDMGRLWSFLRRLAYPRAQGVVLLTEAMRAYFSDFVSSEVMSIFYNPIEFPDRIPDENVRTNTILYLGRLANEKGVDTLLQAFSRCGQTGWTLLIAGDGPDRPILEKMSASLNISNSVHFLGHVTDVIPLLESVALLALPSKFEGLPNALCEAMVMGLPTVATATTGACAVIQDGRNGLLVPPGDVECLRKALMRLIDDRNLRKILGQEALKLREHVRIDAVMGKWDALVREVTGKEHGGIR